MLLRHRGGNYYASTKVSGKVIRRSLDTDDFNIAKNRLDGVLAEIRGAKHASKAGTLWAALEAEAARQDPSIKSSTQNYYQHIARSLAKSAATLPVDAMGLSIAKITMPELRAMMDKFATVAVATRTTAHWHSYGAPTSEPSNPAMSAAICRSTSNG